MNPRSRRWSTLLALVALSFSMLSLAACGGDDDSTAPPPPTQLPQELVADWAIASVTVNDTLQDPAEFFEWEEGTTGAMMMLSSDGSYVEEEYSENRSVLAESTGTISIQGNEITVTDTTTGSTEVFHGTWTVNNHVLTLRQNDGTDVIVLSFHQIRTINMQFTVREVDDFAGLLEGKITEGMLGRGFYSYDLAPSNMSCSSDSCLYNNNLSPCGIFVDLGGIQFRSLLSNPDIYFKIINDGEGSDLYHFASRVNNVLPNMILPSTYSIRLEDETGQALNSTAIPVDPPVLDDWSQEEYGLVFTGQNISGFFDFTVKCTITLVAIGG